MAKSSSKPVKVRIPDQDCAQVRQRALKYGAVSVTTRTVSPGITESTAEFKQNNSVKMFLEWLQKNKYPIVEECNGV